EADGDDVPIEVIRAPHEYGRARAIAARLRAARLGADDAPLRWNDMAVIARTGAQLRHLHGQLTAMDIPCDTSREPIALRHEPAVTPLLTMMRVALGDPWDYDAALAVLGSRLVGLDSVAIRRLRRTLVREDRAAGGTTSGA